jgi:hypothetical protein
MSIQKNVISLMMEKKMENKTWTLNVEENEDGDQFIVLPDEILQQLDLKEGDTMEWIDNKDGSWTLVKKDMPHE